MSGEEAGRSGPRDVSPSDVQGRQLRMQREVPRSRSVSSGSEDEEPPEGWTEVDDDGLTSTLKRASMFVAEGIGDLLGVGGGEAAEPEESPPQPSSSSSSRPANDTPSSSSTRGRPHLSFQAAARRVQMGAQLAQGCSSTVDMAKLLREVRRPFKRLIMEVQKPSVSCARGARGELVDDRRRSASSIGADPQEVATEGSDGEAREEQSRDQQARSPLLSAIVRARLIGYVLGCCEAVASELSSNEARVWDAFVSADSTLTGTIGVHNGELEKVLTDCFGESERLQLWIDSFSDNLAGQETDEIDFADILQWHHECQEVEGLYSVFGGKSVRESLVAGFGQIIGAARPAAPRMQPQRISELRTRCAKMAPAALAEAAVAYQRSLMLTSCWQCEHKMTKIIEEAVGPGGDAKSDAQPVHVLLSLLRSINCELAPTERVLWEVIGSKDKDFDGGFTKQEVLAGIGELLVYTLERELATPSEDFEELQKLRSECQRRSVETLFGDKRVSVTISDIIWWWWDLPEEYRIAAGLSVPAALLRRSVTRKPEEMFKDKLRLSATNVSVANTALRGHVKVLAELRALVVRRTIEGLHCRSPTETWTTTTSDAGGTSAAPSEPKSARSNQREDLDDDEDGEAVAV